MSKTKLALDVVQDLRILADSIEALANAETGDALAESTPVNTTPMQPAEPKLTLVELRAFVAERSTPENRPKIKAILNRFGVAELTELTEEQFAAVKREVAAL